MSKSYDPLPSWHEGNVKQRIFTFVEQVTQTKSADFVPEEDRIAVFDHDGTLWVEKPTLAQLAFYKSETLYNDQEKAKGAFFKEISWLKSTFIDIYDLLKVTAAYFHSGLTTSQYRTYVSEWISHAKHPRYKRLYTELTYLPMLELIAYLEENGFTNYIVSGGTADFIRPWAESIYKIKAEHIIGSSVKTKLSKRNGQLSVLLEPIPFFFDYRSGKVLGIERVIAKRPIAAFGNSLGDADMLRWTAANKLSLCMLIHHTDKDREYKYSPDPWYYFGKSTLDYAKSLNWLVVDMKRDWRKIFSFKP